METCDERFEKVSFDLQDAWSLGCILLWMLTGQEPFCLTQDDMAEVDMNDSIQVQNAIRKRQLVWVCFFTCKPDSSLVM